MALHHQAAAVLEEATVRRINFQVGGLPVTSHQLSRVKAKLREGKIKVYVYNRISDAAQYFPARNSIVIYDAKVFRSIYGKSAIVHESVHAMTDMNKARSTTLYSAEVAGFLAQMIYAEAAGDRTFRRLAQIINPMGRIAKETLKLIDQHDMKNKVVNFSRPHYEDLRKAIKAHPTYRGWTDTQLFPADGV